MHFNVTFIQKDNRVNATNEAEAKNLLKHKLIDKVQSLELPQLVATITYLSMFGRFFHFSYMAMYYKFQTNIFRIS